MGSKRQKKTNNAPAPGFRHQKKLGQNFLTDPEIVRGIAAASGAANRGLQRTENQGPGTRTETDSEQRLQSRGFPQCNQPHRRSARSRRRAQWKRRSDPGLHSYWSLFDMLRPRNRAAKTPPRPHSQGRGLGLGLRRRDCDRIPEP